MDPITGTLCKTNLISNNQLIREIVNSTFRYLDELGHICVNLYVFASRREIRYQTELNSIVFDPKNCSFNIIKICIDKKDFNFNPPCLNKTVHCEAGKLSDRSEIKQLNKLINISANWFDFKRLNWTTSFRQKRNVFITSNT